ncbi:hypothetical protein RchiOBHm_Chr6g0261831 [Rosa chinensis]|uniref:Uncharacterized protein n=1 Tax=Rosa chinensis TaxID=74649 RepID=A0A2P6PNI3_ROSCH|nr:hypothetical protein RchiOBHm_Chr6g0261831 [Rosa chinensis]
MHELLLALLIRAALLLCFLLCLLVEDFLSLIQLHFCLFSVFEFAVCLCNFIYF